MEDDGGGWKMLVSQVVEVLMVDQMVLLAVAYVMGMGSLDVSTTSSLHLFDFLPHL